MGNFLGFWIQTMFIMCMAVFGVALLGLGLPGVLAVAPLFWPIVFLSGVIAFFNASSVIDGIGGEISQRLQKK